MLYAIFVFYVLYICLCQYIVNIFPVSMISILSIIICTCVMIHYSWQLALLVIGFSFLAVLVRSGFLPITRNATRRMMMKDIDTEEYILESIRGIETIKASDMEGLIFGEKVVWNNFPKERKPKPKVETKPVLCF